jgi:hypothetical protein
MPISFTDEYLVSKKEFYKTGAFDMILDVDSRVFIDPTLLDKCKIPEFNNSKAKVKKYFSNIVLLLSHSNNSSDGFWKKADALLSFKELNGTCTGYSRVGTSGNAIGPILRARILQSTKELIDVGEKDPDIFELLGVFQENVGCDRISDLITYILAPEILSFTQRVVVKFHLSDKQIDYKQQKYKTRVNKYNNKPIMLLPSSVLSPLPVFEDFDSIDIICAMNEQMRREINAFFDLGQRSKLSKEEIYSLMKSNPDFREALLAALKM